MRRKQLGIGLASVFIGGTIFIVVALVGMKMAPSYIEFFSIKKAINALGDEARGGASVQEIRRGFDNRATIDAVDSVKGSDLEITKDGTGTTISVAYRREIPLVSNVGVYIDFAASSK